MLHLPCFTWRYLLYQHFQKIDHMLTLLSNGLKSIILISCQLITLLTKKRQSWKKFIFYKENIGWGGFKVFPWQFLEWYLHIFAKHIMIVCFDFRAFTVLKNHQEWKILDKHKQQFTHFSNESRYKKKHLINYVNANIKPYDVNHI